MPVRMGGAKRTGQVRIQQTKIMMNHGEDETDELGRKPKLIEPRKGRERGQTAVFFGSVDGTHQVRRGAAASPAAPCGASTVC